MKVSVYLVKALHQKQQIPVQFNPTALRKAKVAYNFGLSECNRVKILLTTIKHMPETVTKTDKLEFGLSTLCSHKINLSLKRKL